MGGPVTPSYDRVARAYDWLAAFYSGGAIGRSKQVHLAWLEGGERVLYAGAGTASECVEARARGAHVTVCDMSEKMLQLARHRFEGFERSAESRPRERRNREMGTVEFLAGDVRSVPGPFDIIVAPYFLNVFSRSEVTGAIAALAARLTSGGRLIVVDFRGPSAARLFWFIQRLYYFLPQILFLLLTKNPWHELYDYEKLAREAAPFLTLKRQIGTRAFGLPLFETLYFEKEPSS